MDNWFKHQPEYPVINYWFYFQIKYQIINNWPDYHLLIPSESGISILPQILPFSVGCAIMECFHLPSLRLLLLTLCYVIDLLCNNKDVAAYTTLLTAWSQVCFWMNILHTMCTTYGYGLYTQLVYLWAWLILIITHDPTCHQYYSHMYMHDIIYWWGEHQSYVNSYHYIPFLLQRHIVGQSLDGFYGWHKSCFWTSYHLHAFCI